MTCAACAGHIESALNKLPGVTATVNVATETANINFIPGAVTIDDLITAVINAGYGASEISETSRSEEKSRRLAAYHHELRMFWISAVLTLPLVLQMGVMFSDNGGELLPRWLQWLLSNTGAILDWTTLLHWRMARTTQRRRQYGCTGCTRHQYGLFF